MCDNCNQIRAELVEMRKIIHSQQTELMLFFEAYQAMKKCCQLNVKQSHFLQYLKQAEITDNLETLIP